MARVNFIGFESGTLLEEAGLIETAGGATCESGANVVKSGSFWLRINMSADATHQGVYVANPIAGSLAIVTAYHSFDFAYVTKPSSGYEIIAWGSRGGTTFSSSTAKFFVHLNSDGTLAFADGASTVLGTGSTVLSANTKYRIDVKAGTGTTAAWEIRINGVSEISNTTLNQTINETAFVLGRRAAQSQSKAIDVSYDNLTIDDAAYAAITNSIALIKADGNGTYTAWTGDSTDVDDTPPADGDTTDIDTPDDPNAESATMSSCAGAGITGTINSVKTNVVGRNAGSAVNLQARLRSGSTDSDSGNYATASTYSGFGHVLNTDPNGGGAWTISGVDGIEVGVEHNQSQTRTARCTAFYAMVDYTPAVVASLPPFTYPMQGIIQR